MKKEYRTIVIPLDDQTVEKVPRFIRELSTLHNSKDILFEYDNNKLTVLLRALDLEVFRTSIRTLNQRHQLDDSISPFSHLLSKIEKIGSYGVKGGKRIFAGFADERKVKNRAAKEKKRGMHFYATGRTFAKNNNDVPSEFVNKVICDDSERFLKRLPDNCVDLVLTSPPYNFGLDYETTDDDLKWKKYFDKLFAIFDECIRVLKYGGRIVVNVQPLFSDYIPTHHIISNFFMGRKLIWKGEIVWEKHNYNCKYTAWGSWKSPSSPYLKYTWEFLEIFCKGTLTKKGDKEKIDITGDEFKNWVLAKWSIAPEKKMRAHKHPAMFPEELVTRVLKLFSFEDDLILDPFNGAGTTTAVAKALGRRCLGIDISEDYCQTAKRRLSETLF